MLGCLPARIEGEVALRAAALLLAENQNQPQPSKIPKSLKLIH